MAQTTSKTFSTLAALMAALLIGTAGVIYYMQSSADDGSRSHAALAALSQALPRHAANAAAGVPLGFEQLENDATRLDGLMAVDGELPGSRSQWRALGKSVAALLEKRSAVGDASAALALVDEHLPLLLSASDALLDQSGAIGVIQEFQASTDRIGQSLKNLRESENVDADTKAIEFDLAYLRQVTDALAGGDTDLDLVALDEATREVALGPVADELARVEREIAAAIQSVKATGDLGAFVAAVGAAADDLFANAFPVRAVEASGSKLMPWVPIGLVVLALLLLGGLASMHAKSAVFEQNSIEQSQQNERNQQAILRLLDELGSLADGDLTVEATVTEDITGAIADSINYAIEKLRELVATINDTAILVDSAAKQTESTASNLARAADNQGREINAATESIVSMARSIEEVSGDAERSSDVARHSVDVAHKGGEAVRRTIDGMNTIRETIQDTSKRIKRLGESSQEIGNIVELINDIAEQTNILALNASIQASMAGEAGRGFAVVADEVQRLAERSTNATKQIEVLVRTIQADTNEAVVSMERSTTDVVGGALLAENAGAALDEIEQVSNQIASLVQNISSSARQQASSAADVTRRTGKLKEISEQTGRATTATAAAISKLSELASKLRKTVAGFTLPGSALGKSALSGVTGPTPIRSEVQAKDQAAG